MKKLLSKIQKRKQPKEPDGRITTDTLAVHREKVIAGGRKYKYPVQYARHKLVINASIIAGAALVLLLIAVWVLLYPVKNSSDFMYRVTRVLPVPVASVDGQMVRYSDYLMKYRSALHYLTEKERVDIHTEDGKRQRIFVQNSAMDDAVADAYAQKLAKQQHLTVSSSQVDAFLERARHADDEEISEAAQAGVLADYYGWTVDEYRDVIRQKLLRQAVSYKVDEAARSLAKKIAGQAKSDASFKDIAGALNAGKNEAVLYMPAAWLPRENQDGGLAQAAAKLKKGEVSEAIKTPGDGYYFVRLVDSNDTQVEYEYLHVPLKQFDKNLRTIKKNGDISYYIEIPEQKDASRRKE